ncbi:hypothetical protein GCM10008995_14400 [Halobellus salinus]|uniref:Uncharacterized protein n=1 Tax=Halobellus salinus TaxID=931585 RepID=A0A830EAI6_9EURY|nr:hypothetical protein [Halobellus salinus]GGJ05695.1 hypothetical protein GCM10008995_14400 [Halobellus salinus]SMP23732.1 hypothetical protein SAMN06265347_10987 [Halobellus salinus]
MDTDGPHHATAAASDPQENRRFDTNGLGPEGITGRVGIDDTTTHHRCDRTRVDESDAALASVPVGGAPPGSCREEPGGTPGVLAEGEVAG